MNRKPSISRLLTHLCLALSAYAAVPAQADPIPPAPAPADSAPKSRAEVIADLAVYQESGLAVAERLQAELGEGTVAVAAARERYAQMRRGERYASLMARHAQRKADTPQQARSENAR